MSFTNLTRENRFFQKKSECFFAGEVVVGSESFEIPAGVSDNYIMVQLPPDSIITDAYIHVEVASDAATTAVATLGTTEGGTEILSAADLTTLGEQGTFTGQSLTTTGKDVYLGIAITGAETAVGKYIVTVEYLEYRKNNGDYTRFNNDASTTP